jgi:hypothetical protein
MPTRQSTLDFLDPSRVQMKSLGETDLMAKGQLHLPAATFTIMAGI